MQVYLVNDTSIIGFLNKIDFVNTHGLGADSLFCYPEISKATNTLIMNTISGLEEMPSISSYSERGIGDNGERTVSSYMNSRFFVINFKPNLKLTNYLISFFIQNKPIILRILKGTKTYEISVSMSSSTYLASGIIQLESFYANEELRFKDELGDLSWVVE